MSLDGEMPAALKVAAVWRPFLILVFGGAAAAPGTCHVHFSFKPDRSHVKVWPAFLVMTKDARALLRVASRTLFQAVPELRPCRDQVATELQPTGLSKHSDHTLAI